MNAHISTEQSQHEVLKESTSLVELLAMLILGGAAMFATLLGIYFDNLILYTVGLVAVIASTLGILAKSGKAILEFINAIFDFKARFKKKDNHDTSK